MNRSCSATNCFPAYDGNGNVMGLVNAADGTQAAEYDYGPFGELIRQTGPMAKANPFRFSSKYDDDESDLLYYGYRYYKPSTGTWPSRDPLGDWAFLRMQIIGKTQQDREGLREQSRLPNYLFVVNDSVDSYDINGLVPPAAGACVIVIALPEEVPVGAIIVGTVVVAGVTYVTYEVCKEICPVICPKINEIDEPPYGKPGDPDYKPGYKICVYKCANQGLVRRYFPEGTSCKSFIIERW